MPLRCFKKALAPFISPALSALLQYDKVTFTFEAIGDGKVRVSCQSWDDAKIILADQALQVIALGKKIMHVMRAARPAEYLNVELNGLADAAYGPRRRNGGTVTA